MTWGILLITITSFTPISESPYYEIPHYKINYSSEKYELLKNNYLNQSEILYSLDYYNYYYNKNLIKTKSVLNMIGLDYGFLKDLKFTFEKPLHENSNGQSNEFGNFQIMYKFNFKF